MATQPETQHPELYDEIAGLPRSPQTGLTYDDLRAFPEDNFRRELLDGELVVTAAPPKRHQAVVARLTARMLEYAETHGGEVFPAPLDVYFAFDSVVEPDVVFVRPEHVDDTEERYIRTPTVVIEVSSPSTRRLELVRKRELFERYEVPEYWYVDLAADRVEIYHLGPDGYRQPVILGLTDELTSPALPGFSVEVAYLLAAPSPAS